MAINNRPDVHQLVICANCFVRKDDKYLVLRRSPKKKYAPGVVHPIGGKVELDENPLIAAERELLEEAGVKVANIKLEAIFLEIEPIPGEAENWLIYHFSADYKTGKVKTTEEGELIWLSGEEIKNEKLFVSLRLFINQILDPSLGTVFSTMWYNQQKTKIIKHTSDMTLL